MKSGRSLGLVAIEENQSSKTTWNCGVICSLEWRVAVCGRRVGLGFGPWLGLGADVGSTGVARAVGCGGLKELTGSCMHGGRRLLPNSILMGCWLCWLQRVDGRLHALGEKTSSKLHADTSGGRFRGVMRPEGGKGSPRTKSTRSSSTSKVLTPAPVTLMTRTRTDATFVANWDTGLMNIPSASPSKAPLAPGARGHKRGGEGSRGGHSGSPGPR